MPSQSDLIYIGNLANERFWGSIAVYALRVARTHDSEYVSPRRNHKATPLPSKVSSGNSIFSKIFQDDDSKKKKFPSRICISRQGKQHVAVTISKVSKYLDIWVLSWVPNWILLLWHPPHFFLVRTIGQNCNFLRPVFLTSLCIDLKKSYVVKGNLQL